MNYAILVDESTHFELDDPQKFYNKIEELCKKNDKSLLTTLGYYYRRHRYVQLIRIGDSKTGIENMLDIAALEMNMYFEEWLGEEWVKAIEESIIKELLKN